MIKIEAVAFKMSNGDVIALARPNRHHHLFPLANLRGYSKGEQFEAKQGFITNQGQFVDREEALLIAKAAGQIIRPDANTEKELYSEGMW